MKLEVQTGNVPQTQAITSYVEKRFSGALDRFNGEISRLMVRLGDENGPKGGRDKCCRVELHFTHGHHGQPIVVEERDWDLYTSIGRASKSLKQVLARQFGKRKHSHGAGLRGRGAHGNIKPR